MTPWLTPRHRHDLILARPVAYVTPCGGALWLRGRYQTALAGLTCDHVITDPPYSARTHKWHNEGVNTATAAQRAGEALARGIVPANDIGYARNVAAGLRQRRSIEYAAWGAPEIRSFAAYMAGMGAGWIVAMCSHDQHRDYCAAATAQNRYAFDYPVVWYAPGSRVRMTGDGPANWTAWLAVSRTRALSKWGALPGGYMHTTKSDQNAGDYRIGGKPLALMLDLVSDYSREGDTVCDPCGGYATTGVAALRLGRRFVGVECDPEAWAHGRDRLAREARQTRMVLSEVQESLI